jgi:hypothetical protein
LLTGADTQLDQMKKTIILLTISLLISFVGYAQRGLHIGLTIAPSSVFIVNQNNFETLDRVSVISRSELDYKLKWGYAAGLQLGFNFNKHFGLQSGVGYVRTGQNYEDTFNPGAPYPTPYNVVRKVDLRYIRVPLTFQYKFHFNNTKFKMYTSIGPYFGWLLSASESVTLNDTVRTDLTPAIEKFNSLDIGMSLGVGGEYFITKNIYLNMGLAIDYGFTDMNGKAVKNLEWFSKNDVGYKKSNNFNAGLSMGIHYIFNPGASNPFKKKGGGGDVSMHY